MKQERMNQSPEHMTSDSVKDRVFSTIAEAGVEPRSKYVFLCQNWLVWGLWGLSIVFGALAIAVLLFVSTHRYYDLYEATHENFFTFLLDALPYIWFFVFGCMLLLAVWQLKHTKRGYRLSAPVLAVSSFIFSVVLGGLFHIGGFGWSLDRWLGQVAPMYASQAEMERKMWQNPLAGRLVGTQLANTPRNNDHISFEDVSGRQWSVSIMDLTPTDLAYLAEGKKVRLLGARMEADGLVYFHACGVFPWMLDKAPVLARTTEERKMFVDRMYKHYEDSEARRIAIEQSLHESKEVQDQTSPCHSLAAVERVHKGMHR